VSDLARRAGPLPALALDEAVSALAWQGGALVAASAAGSLHWIDPRGARLHQRVEGHGAPITALAADPRGEWLASAGEDGRVRLWCGTEVRATWLHAGDWIEHLAWSRRGDYLAAAGGRRLWVWRRDATPLRDAEPFPTTVSALAWSPVVDQLLVGGYRCLHLLPATAGPPLQQLAPGHAVTACDWSPDGKSFAVGLQDKYLELWRREPRQARLRRFLMRGYPHKVAALSYARDGRWLASAGGRDVVLWSTARQHLGNSAPTVWREHRDTVTRLAHAPAGEPRLASADRNGRVLLWNSHGQWRDVLTAPAPLTTLSWQPDGGLLAAGSEAGVLYLLH